MTPAQVELYNGKEYLLEGNGPDQWGCWFLLRHCLAEYFGVTMPLAPIGDEKACLELYTGKVRTGEWKVVPYPQHGDPVLMRGGILPHVGLFLDIDGGGILHALEDVGVTFSSLGACYDMGFGNLKFYRVVNK